MSSAVPNSAAYARIKADILRIVAAIPNGRIATYGAIGSHLDVMPRHVAYILTMLSDEEQARYPWYRVAGDRGRLGKPKFNGFGISQAELLSDEGVEVRSGSVVEFEKRVVLPGSLAGSS